MAGERLKIFSFFFFLLMSLFHTEPRYRVVFVFSLSFVFLMYSETCGRLLRSFGSYCFRLQHNYKEHAFVGLVFAETK